MKTKKSYIVNVRFIDSQKSETIVFENLQCAHDYLNEIANEVTRDFVFTVQTINSHVCDDNCDMCD